MEEEKAQRDPIILTRNPNFVLPEAGKTLMRLGPKTCPTPMGPTDEKALHTGFVRFRENLRWAWHHNKGLGFEEILDTFEKKPWYEKTERLAPVARDCPQLEAFLDACYQDLFDPTLRKKISDNLTKEQRDFIKKDVKTIYPNLNIRIRKEDKGHRFVIVDGEEEDKQIEEELQKPDQYEEIESDPTEQYQKKLEEFAARGLENGEIDGSMSRFIANQQKTSTSSQEAEKLHPANPKPTRKTHKLGPDGEMIEPVPPRVITVGCGTPVHNLSKVCAEGIKHLTNPASLPHNNKNTAEVLKRVIFINKNFTPLPPEAALALADIKSMYPSVDCEQAIQVVKEKLEQDPSPLGMSADFITEGLKLCIKCNCVQFKGKFYIPCKGCAQGPCHACDFTDIWIGTIVKKHIESSNIVSVLFSIYRDDDLDILKNGKVDQPAFQQQLDSLHPALVSQHRMSLKHG